MRVVIIKRLTSQRRKTVLLLGLFALMASVGLFGLLRPAGQAQAATGINQQINFQGRLLTPNGATVADAAGPTSGYNVEFKIYQDGTGCVSGGSSPCGGTLLWTEDDINYNSNGISVRNGYFSVMLGAVCP